MRTLRNAACIAVALGSVALAVWQPIVASDLDPPGLSLSPAGSAVDAQVKPVDQRLPRGTGRASLAAPVVKT